MRTVTRSALAAALSVTVAGCIDAPSGIADFRLEDATIETRPVAPTLAAPALGWTTLGLGTTKDGRLYLPAGYTPETPVALVILLHSADQNSGEWVSDDVAELADEFNIAILAPDSRGRTWDALRGGAFGADVTFIDQALAHVFRRVNVRSDKVVLGGFSDGASYALSLGLINGDLFDHLVAWSPALVYAPEQRGEPFIFISHGVNDGVVAVQNSRNNLVPELRNAGYEVEYVEFTGGHVIPFDVAREAFSWILSTGR